MSKVLVEESSLISIGGAIRSKNGSNTAYKPSEMATAINALEMGITPSGTVNISQNGTMNVTQYASATVNVPNSYIASDEGKVVSNGALVTQTERASEITQNGTYDTTINNSIVVNVSGGTEADPALPSQYQEVEYIDFSSDGNAYVYIPVALQVLDMIYAEVEITNWTDKAQIWLFSTYFNINTSLGGVGITNISGYTGIATKGNNSIAIGEKATQIVILTTVGNNPGFYLNTINQNDDFAFKSRMYVLRLKKLYDGEVYKTTLCLKPCYRKQDNVIGFYDVYGNAFYPQSGGAGSLSKGPDIV